MEQRICKYCGEPFIPNSNHQQYCTRVHYMECPICGKKYEVTSIEKLKRPPTVCSYACRSELTRRRSLEKYGVTAPGNTPEAREKAKKTCLEHFGVPYAMMSKEVYEKAKATNMKKYGVDNVAKNKEILEKRMSSERSNHGGVLAFNTEASYAKRKKTVEKKFGGEVFANEEIKQKIRDGWMEKYGTSVITDVPEVKEKIQATMLERYHTIHAFASPEVREKGRQTMLERYGVDNAGKSEELMLKAKQTCFERYGTCARISSRNLELGEAITKLGYKIEYEKFLQGLWYDIHVQERKLLIEVDPTYTHNAIGNHWDDNGTPHDYHLKKSQLAAAEGYRCIHVFDWDNVEQIVNLLQPTTKIDARKCKIVKLFPKVSKAFLMQYHLQRSCRGQLLHVGLVYDGILYQVMTFGRPRYNKSYEIELLRLCTKPGYRVVGGASKLFHWAVNTYELDNIISYCDRAKFSGAVYERIGMKLVKTSPPQEIWSRQNQFITANLLRQRGYDQLFKTNFGTTASNEQLMLSNGWLPVYDCGQDIYEFKSSNLM